MLKNNNQLLIHGSALLLMLTLLSSCRQVPIRKEIVHTEQLAQSITGESVDYCAPYSVHDLDILVKDGLSRDEAIRIALRNNRALRASLQELGIAKADLVQAGLFKNPTIFGAFHIPHRDKNLSTNIEIETTILSLTDLWQVPLRKKAFCAKLEKAMHELVYHIFKTMGNARSAYDKVLFNQKLLVYTKNMLAQTEKLRDNLEHRYQFGLEHDGAKYLTQATVGFWEAQVVKATADLYAACAQLSYVLGIDPTRYESYRLTDSFSTPPPVDSVEHLVSWAHANHPEIQIMHKKIDFYERTLTYERASRIKTVDLGIAHKREFDKNIQGTGPSFHIDVPLFDRNQAPIARAYYSLKKAERELCDTQLRIKADIVSRHKTLSALRSTLEKYEHTILLYTKKALEFTEQYQKEMQITIPTVIQTQKELYDAQRSMLEVAHQAYDTYTQLEQAVGKRLAESIRT